MVTVDPDDPFLACSNCGHAQEDHGPVFPPAPHWAGGDRVACDGNAPDPCGCHEFEHEPGEPDHDDEMDPWYERRIH